MLSQSNAYIRSVLKPDGGALLRSLEASGRGRGISLVLPETAAVLKQLVYLKRPSKILEIGTATGYSGIIMLSMFAGAELTTIEIDEDLCAEARRNFEAAGLSPRVSVFNGDASEILPLTDGEFDFVFLDGPKAHYSEYLPFIKKRLKRGGLLACDNVLFGGMVSGEIPCGKRGSLVRKLDSFLRAVCSDPDFLASVIPVGDGLCAAVLL
ncbi:MAG: O-methyltransferase [Clostridiales bacterium]|jgi:predicted O-methyltransferase YrrM|nr:O-methyltransferase [Clostridiales bacterium]